MKIHNEITQGTPEWSALHIGKFGSTDAYAVSTAGKGLDTLVYNKVAEIVLQHKPESVTNSHMERGIELEDTARASYEIETGAKVEQVGMIELDEYSVGSPDGLVGNDGLIEIKCPTPANFIKVFDTRTPNPEYIWQMQYLMYITDRQWCDFCAFSAELDKIVIVRIDRDEEKIAKLKDGLKLGIKKICQLKKKIQEL